MGLALGRLEERDARRKKSNIIKLRKKYLDELATLNANGYDRVCADESYIHENYSIKHSWYSPVDGKELQKPFGVDRRIVLQATVASDGWLDVDLECLTDYFSLEDNKIHSYKTLKYWPVK